MANKDVDINRIFLAALKETADLEKYGTKNKLAKAVKISPSQFNRVCTGDSNTTENLRRAIASHLGYPYYESFLNIGRKILRLPEVKTPEKPNTPEPLIEENRKLKEELQEQKIAFLNRINNLSGLIFEQQEEIKCLKQNK
jgi:transcriptional regulator with XRE-family HTH domain